jgi:hypothetical protein
MTPWDCPDCGVDAWHQVEDDGSRDGRIVHEDFHVHNELWDATVPEEGGVRIWQWNADGSRSSRRRDTETSIVMCIGCFEKRLGRQLVRSDFTESPAADLLASKRTPSQRYLERYYGEP